ncbi:MAG: hypothetical protein AAF678_05605 [Pseudomonadota bacterium]
MAMIRFFDDTPEDEAQAGLLGSDAVGDVDANDGPSSPWSELWEPPGPVGEAFFFSDADVNLLRGPVGSGKTTLNLRKRFRRAMTAPRSVIDKHRRYKCVVARTTFRQIWNTSIPSWLEVIGREHGKWSGGRGDPVRHELQWEDDHGLVLFEIEFQAFGESLAEIEANVRGVQTTDFAFEEADTIPLILFTTAMGRINRYPQKMHFEGYGEEHRSYGLIDMTYNAPDSENYLAQIEDVVGGHVETKEHRQFAELIKDEDFNIQVFRQPGGNEDGAENLPNLAPDYYKKQRAAMLLAGRSDQITRLIDNRIGVIKEGDLVFEGSWNADIHVAREPLQPDRRRPLLIGLDQGFFGAAVIGQFFEPYQWVIHRELWFPERMHAADFGQELRDLLDRDFEGFEVAGAFSDMAGEQGSALAQDGENWNQIVGSIADIDIEPQLEGMNRIQPRLNAVRAALDWIWRGQPGLLIDPSCKLLIKGFGGSYVWAREADKDGKGTVKPKKSGNRSADVIDALQYLTLSEQTPEGMAPIEGKPRVPGRDRHGIGGNGGPPINASSGGAGDFDLMDYHRDSW